MRKFNRGLVSTVLLLVFGAGAAALIQQAGSLVELRLEERWRAERLSELAAVRARLEGELNGTFNLTAGLIAQVAMNHGIGRVEFERHARELMAERSLLRNITLAPDNVISLVYPLAGNEAALGLDLLNHPLQGPATRRMLANARPVLAGPVDLVQGGRALIYRVPIYLSRPGEPPRSGRYWGLMSTPIDFDALLARAGLLDPELPFRVALRGIDELGAQGAPFWGEAALFAQPAAFVLDVRTLDGAWQLAAVPLNEPAMWSVVSRSANAAAALVLLGSVLLAWSLHRVSRRLASSERDYRLLAEQISDVLFRTDRADRIVYLNPAWSRLTGRPTAECVGRAWVDLMRPNDGGQADASASAVAMPAPGGDGGEAERVTVVDRDGKARTLVVRASAHFSADGVEDGRVGILVDVTERERLEEQVRHLALHDVLTGLPNRMLLAARFDHAVDLARREGWRMAVLYLDLDGFKPVNDRFGHEAGDRVLREVAARLRQLVRQSDTVARVGGDEFLILLGRIASVADAQGVADKVCDVLRRPVAVSGEQVVIGASVGIGLYPDHGRALGDLMRRADQAMYTVKSDGGAASRLAVARGA